MAGFDPSQPHGTVHGPTVPTLFVQNGVTYDAQHRPVELQEDGSLKEVLVAVKESQELEMADGDFRAMPTDKLKQVCAVYGIEFKSRQQALAELEGR